MKSKHDSNRKHKTRVLEYQVLRIADKWSGTMDISVLPNPTVSVPCPAVLRGMRRASARAKREKKEERKMSINVGKKKCMYPRFFPPPQHSIF